MASRTIENERDRRMTIMTTCFIPCGAKMPIIGLIAGALFGGSSWVATSAYFIGFAAIIISGIILKKTKLFAGDPAPFVMELPAYHVPAWGNVLRATWERGWSFIKRAGTVILAATIILWFLQGFGFENGAFTMVEDQDNSILAIVASAISWIFIPQGFGNWRATVASISGLIAKENVVGTFGVLYHYADELSENGDEIWPEVAASFTADLRLQLYDLQPAVRSLLRCYGRHQARDEQRQVDRYRHRLYVPAGLLRFPGCVPDRRPDRW